jgi:phospholipid/cholesterol/gamma-HCH transport system ATP-binding protein
MPDESKNEVVLELRDVSIARRGKPVLVRVNLEVRAREALGVVFLRGGGRSTLLSVASGLLAPDSGEVLYRGRPLSSLGTREVDAFRKATAMVFEHGGLLVNTTCFNNVALPLRYHTRLPEDEIEVKVMDLLGVVGMREARDHFPWELTIGKQRLVALARALAREPELIFFDNFFQGSEPLAWRKLTRVMQESRERRGTAFVLVLEADPTVYSLADRLLVIEDGHVLEAGAPQSLKESKNKRVTGIFSVEALGEEL